MTASSTPGYRYPGSGKWLQPGVVLALLRIQSNVVCYRMYDLRLRAQLAMRYWKGVLLSNSPTEVYH
eukprot:2247283-Rhodomonas_salina.1